MLRGFRGGDGWNILSSLKQLFAFLASNLNLRLEETFEGCVCYRTNAHFLTHWDLNCLPGNKSLIASFVWVALHFVINFLFLHSDLSSQNAWLQALTNYLYKKEVTLNSIFFGIEYCWFNRWTIKGLSIISSWPIQSFYCNCCLYTH